MVLIDQLAAGLSSAKYMQAGDENQGEPSTDKTVPVSSKFHSQYFYLLASLHWFCFY